MRERVFNVFLFVTEDAVTELGITAHLRDGSDDDKTAFLQKHVNTDWPKSARHPVPDGCIVIDADGKSTHGRISYESFLTLTMNRQHMRVLEPMFASVAAPQRPLMVITPIVDGVPRIQATFDFSTAGKK